MVSRVKQVLLAIGITIIFNFFVFYGIETFYESPKYENYCNSSAYLSRPVPAMMIGDSNSTIDCRDCIEAQGSFSCRQCSIIAHGQGAQETQSSCEAAKGKWNPQFTGEPVKETAGGYCDYDYYCRTSFEKNDKVYQRNVFIISMIIGIVTVIISLFITLESVSSGFMAGGIIVMIISLIRYWNELNKQLRFIIIAVVLIILVWVGYKKLNPKIQEMKQARTKKRK